MLHAALQSLYKQTFDHDRYEVIVVDNCSTDATASSANIWSTTWPNLRYFYEPRLGLNTARNRGWCEAFGEWIAYIDDDALASSQWLEMWNCHISDIEGMVVGGGCVLPQWGGKRPGWLPEQLERVFTVLDHGPESRWLVGSETIVGTNMVFKRTILAETGGFDENVGRVGAGLATYGGDETELLERLRRTGYGLFYSSVALVQHVIAPERQRLNWLLRRVYMEGRTQPILDSLSGKSTPYSWRRLLYDVKEAIMCILHTLLKFALLSSKDVMLELTYVAQRLGRSSEELQGIVSGRGRQTK
jgi:GT2 family glycosyltransferase